MAQITFDNEKVTGLVRAVLKHSKEIDKTPKLLFVKDEGIYLMAPFEFGKGLNGDGQPRVVYGNNFDPRKVEGEALYDRCREAVGGDDFCEKITVTEEWLKELEDKGHDMIISVTAKSLKFSF